MMRIRILLGLFIVIALASFPAYAQLPGKCHSDCITPDYVLYTGDDFSETFTLPTGGEFHTDCMIDWNLVDLTGPCSCALPRTSLGSDNTVTITKALMDSYNLPPGVYTLDWTILWNYDGGCWDYVNRENGSPNIVTNLMPVSVNEQSQTVHYTCTVNTGAYVGYHDGEIHVPLNSLLFNAYAPDLTQMATGAQLDIPDDAASFTGGLDVTYSKPTHKDSDFYALIFGADYPREFVYYTPHVDQRYYDDWSPDFGLSYSPSNTPEFRECPRCRLSVLTTSTTWPGDNKLEPIEPAYGDSVTFQWSRTYHEFHASSAVILQEDDSGTIVDPDDSSKKYKIVAEEPLGNSTNVVDHGLSEDNEWRWSGELTWPQPGTYVPECPSGHMRVGIKYDDGYVELTDSYFDVNLSIYDVYTEDHAPLCLGDKNEGKTSIYYKMSAPAKDGPGNVHIDVGGMRTIAGTPFQGQNVLEDAWDGITDKGTYVDGGSYGLSFTVIPKAGEIGPLLRMYDRSGENPSFTPATGQTLTLTYDIREPVQRPQATKAKMTVIVYDSTGRLVRLLENDQDANINGEWWDTGFDGYNQVVWDGKDENGNVVEPDAYTVTVFAKDNAGVGCESNCLVGTVYVNDPPQTEVSLEWPSDEGGDYDEDDSGVIAGYTDSNSHTVAYAIDDGDYTTASADDDGAFSIDATNLWGNHTATISTTDSTYGEKTVTVPFFRNELSITNIQDEARFDPQSNGNISVQFNSQIADTVDVYIADPYDQPDAIGPDNPVSAAEMMNGTVSEKKIRVLATGQTVTAGTNTITWDGRDSDGSYVQPGIYNINIERSNSDGLLDTSAVVQVVIEHPTDAPQISNIAENVDGATVSISWDTDTTTTGCVVCQSDDDMGTILKMPYVGSSGTHKVWIPGASPDTTYGYYIVATDPATGTASVSDYRIITTGGGPEIGNTSLTLSGTQLEVDYSSETASAAAIDYARVGPDVSSIEWNRVEDTNVAQEHTFTLTDLHPNAEYVYRTISANDGTFACSTKSNFQSFSTKITSSNVEITNLATADGKLSDITVQASDPIHRYSDYGISAMDLYVDGAPIDSFDKVVDGDYVDYTFHVASLNLTTAVHKIEATACDDYGTETTYSMMERAGQMIGEELMKAQCIPLAYRLRYEAGPYGKAKKGSVGNLYLEESTLMGWKPLGCWPARSGYKWDWKTNGGTMPPGKWKTGNHPRVGVHAEGVPDAHFGAYLIHVDQDPYRCRTPKAFHIHGNWGPPYSPKIGKTTFEPIDDDGTVDWTNGQVFYHTSVGCIILHKRDLEPHYPIPDKPWTLADCWRKYVLDGQQHSNASVGIPLTVKYSSK